MILLAANHGKPALIKCGNVTSPLAAEVEHVVFDEAGSSVFSDATKTFESRAIGLFQEKSTFTSPSRGYATSRHVNIQS